MTYQLDLVKIVQLLTQSTLELNETTLTALADARQNALKRQSARAPVFALTPTAALNRLVAKLMPGVAHPWVAAGLLIAVLVAGTGYWQHLQEQQIDDLDVAILTDDAPIEVFVD